MRRLAWLSFAMIMALSSGCADLSGPRWFDPGTAREQRNRAQKFDPYPDPQVGRNDDSARPRDYLNPPPEADAEARSARARGEQLRSGQPLRW
ncbi:MAG: hypothetical protein HYX69_19835 [Planctomycetia bacterium]|nr:hypothetical protein [Planctomycetia bacterium]